jgi:hypothetical protein
VTTNNKNLLLLDLSDDPLRLIAQHIVENFSDNLPDLGDLIILLPESGSNNILRQYLLEESSKKQCNGLLVPEISTLKTWAKTNLPEPEKTLICIKKAVHGHWPIVCYACLMN